jgi:serine/threonine protein kinase
MVKAALGATQALIDFHRYHYYHRDLKPGNFFVRRQAGASSLVLADFGLSQHPDDDNFCRGMGGTRGYIAPELCRNHYENGRPCSSWDEVVAADTFALGMTIYNIMVGKESLFKHHITAVNEVVMPRKNVQPAKPLTLHEALDNLDATYKQVLQQKPQEVVGDDRLRQEAYKLVLRTIAPDPRQRLSLEQLKAGLAGLL